MSAAGALKSARALGIRVRIDGDALELEAAAPPPPAVIDLLSRHKADILRLLRPANDGWSPDDWQVLFEERAAIAEFDGGLSMHEAEKRAFAYCLTEWLNRSPAPSAPGRCVVCGGGERPCELVPFGTDTSGHAWLHRVCWPAWRKAREMEAITALASMGISLEGLSPTQGR
jgi:hypothetical protein